MQLTTAHKIDAASTPVHAVTVFRSACAEVVRKFTIALKVRDVSWTPEDDDKDSGARSLAVALSL